MQKKSSILVFTTAFRPMIGGSEIALEEVIRRLPDIFFDIITPRHKRDFRMLEMGNNFSIHRVGIGVHNIDKLLFPLLGFFKATTLIRNHHYKAVHAYQASYGGGAAWLLKLFYPKLTFILTMQEGKNLDNQPLLINWFRSLIIKRANIMTVISNYLGEYVKKYTKNKKIFLIPNGVDLSKFQVLNHKLQESLEFQKPHKQTIITVSRLVSKNGLSDLLKAFKILNSKVKIQNSKLIIIGDGPQREQLFILADNLGINDRIEFLGSIPNEKIYQYLSSSSVFVRPSLSEGLGTAFLEAMAAGVPIIGTPIGGIPDFLKDPSTSLNQATGLFSRPGDPEDLAEKINLILSDEVLRENIILNARKLVEDKYDWKIIAEEFRKIYESI